MNRFIYSIPTKIAFGKGQIKMLPEFIKEYGKRVLLVYGAGSIKKSGIYDEVVGLLNENDIIFSQLSGVEPNPQVETVRRGIDICRKEKVEVIVPIGGGSTIDCAKAIAAGAGFSGDVWELVKDNSLISSALPIICVSTVAATGSEMDTSAVISNHEKKDKAEIESSLLYPKASILDATYTFTVSPYQSAAGVADIMSHVFEYYFFNDEIMDIQRDMMLGILKTCVRYGSIVVDEPDNEKARENLMWAASWAINGFISCGAKSSWPAHALEYQLTIRYGVTHGHGMAIIDSAWMKHILNKKTLPYFVRYGKEVFGINDEDADTVALKAIEKTMDFYKKMGLSLTLESIGLKDPKDITQMAKNAVEEFSLDNGGEMSLTDDDAMEIYKKCLE